MHRGDALARIFTVKGRPESNPLLVVVSSVAMARTMPEVSDEASALMVRHWPGALTLVLRARPGVPDLISAGTGTIGVRHPAHLVPAALAERLGEPITAPSANRSGQPPPTTAAGALLALDGQVDIVIDGGTTPGGLPSTVLDLTVSPPLVRRAGAVVL